MERYENAAREFTEQRTETLKRGGGGEGGRNESRQVQRRYRYQRRRAEKKRGEHGKILGGSVCVCVYERERERVSEIDRQKIGQRLTVKRLSHVKTY